MLGLEHLHFEQPWALLALPLPWLAYRWLPAAESDQSALRVPYFAALLQLKHRTVLSGSWRRMLLPALLWLLLLTAAAAPSWEGAAVTLPASGRELMLAVDISGSMQIEDMSAAGTQVSRLIAVKAVLEEFIERRSGDRLGLILFGSQAYLQAPLTYDRATVGQFMSEAQLGFAGRETAIGDAIGLAVKRLRDRPGERHVLILLTDGANTAGAVAPLAAARFAAEHQIVIYTIGVGADQMTVPGLFGTGFGARRVNPSADLDEDTLQQIAELTGGQYFRARDPVQLAGIYAELDRLEPVAGDGEMVRPMRSLAHWPLAVALAVSVCWSCWQLLPIRRWSRSR